jgi:hypothetical protein
MKPSRLRDNLNRARDEYRGLRYPGNLAADVIGAKAALEPVRSSPWRNPWRIAPLAAAAALAVGALLWTLRPPAGDSAGPGGSTPIAQNAPTPRNAPAPEANHNDAVASNASGGSNAANGTATASADESAPFSVVPPTGLASLSMPSMSFSAPAMPSMPTYDTYVTETIAEQTDTTTDADGSTTQSAS